MTKKVFCTKMIKLPDGREVRCERTRARGMRFCYEHMPVLEWQRHPVARRRQVR